MSTGSEEFISVALEIQGCLSRIRDENGEFFIHPLRFDSCLSDTHAPIFALFHSVSAGID